MSIKVEKRGKSKPGRAESTAKTIAIHRDTTTNIAKLARSVAHASNNFIAVSRGNLMFLRQMLTEPTLLELADEALLALKQGECLASNLAAIAHWESFRGRRIGMTAFFAKRQVRFEQLLGDMELHLDIATGLKDVLTDAEYLELAINAMLLNARDAAVGGQQRVCCAARGDGPDSILITVTDAGSGIAGKFKNHIFDAGFTTKKGGHTGIGLWFVKEFARASGGDAWVESGIRGSTCIAMRLPMAEVARKAVSTGKRAGASKGGKK